MATTKATQAQLAESKAFLLAILTPYANHAGRQRIGELLFIDEGGRSSFVYRVFVAVADHRGRPGLRNVTQAARVLYDGRWEGIGGKIRVSGSGFNHMRHVADAVSYELCGDTQALEATEI